MSQEWYVYIGRLRDRRYYVGISLQDPIKLLGEHQSGCHSQFTRAEGLTCIEWVEPHGSLAEARHREQQLKRWTHAKKQALIEGDLKHLKRLARSRGSR